MFGAQTAEVIRTFSQSMSQSIMIRKCWASVLSRCKGKLTKEHIASAAFLKGEGTVFASGHDWTGESRVNISRSSAKAAILCQGHNSQLSPVDTAGGLIGRAFRDVLKAMCEWVPGKENPCRRSVDGNMFERWLLKTALNFVCASPKTYHGFRPNAYLTGLVFGEVPFDYDAGLGLYLAVLPVLPISARIGNILLREVVCEQTVTMHPLFLPLDGGGRGLLGVVAYFWGIPFFLNTIETRNASLVVNSQNLIDPRLFHPPTINMVDPTAMRIDESGPRLDFEFLQQRVNQKRS